MRLQKAKQLSGFIPVLDPTGRALDASQRHVAAPIARALLTRTMAVADSMEGLSTGGLEPQRAYSASQRLILSTGSRRMTSQQPSATQRRSGVELWVN